MAFDECMQIRQEKISVAFSCTGALYRRLYRWTNGTDVVAKMGNTTGGDTRLNAARRGCFIIHVQNSKQKQKKYKIGKKIVR